MADGPRALVRNAADPEQVRRAGRKEHDDARRYQDMLRAALQSPEVRYVFSEILERCGLFASVFDHSGSVMYWREGRRNFGLELHSDLIAADETMVELMTRERRDRLRRDDRATEAHHTARAEEQGNG